MKRLLPLSLLLLGLIAAVGATLWVLRPHDANVAGAIGGPFALTDQNGKTVTNKDLANKITLVFFGYTHCPDVCPTTLSDMTQVLGKLPENAPIAALFITVDPERDTPSVLKDYLSSFDPRIIGLSGSRAQIDAVEKAYRVYSRKVPGSRPEDYSYDHTALVYVIGRTGQFIESLNLDRPAEATAKELQSMF